MAMARAPAATLDQGHTAAADIVSSREMTREICWQRLGQAPLGRVALVRLGRPLIFPVNHVADGHTIVFCTGATSSLGSLTGREPVAFEVDDGDPSTSRGWSVLVTGEIERLDRRTRPRDRPTGRAMGSREERGLAPHRADERDRRRDLPPPTRCRTPTPAEHGARLTASGEHGSSAPARSQQRSSSCSRRGSRSFRPRHDNEADRRKGMFECKRSRSKRSRSSC